MQLDQNVLADNGVFLKHLSCPPEREGSSKPGKLWHCELGALDQPHLLPFCGVGPTPGAAMSDAFDQQELRLRAREKRNVYVVVMDVPHPVPGFRGESLLRPATKAPVSGPIIGGARFRPEGFA